MMPRLLARRAALPAALAGALALVAACGDSAPTGGAAPSLSLEAASARPGEVISVRVRGVTLPAAPVAGRIDTFTVRAGRADDSTLAVLVPAVAAGPRQVELAIGGARLAATLQVTAATVPANATVFVDSVLAGAEGVLEAAAAALAADATMQAGLDTADFRRSRAALVGEMAALRDALDALQPAERAEAAALVAANLPALQAALGASGTPGSAAGAALLGGAPMAALGDDDACTAGANCGQALTQFLRDFRRSAVKLGIVLLGIDIASAAGGPGAKVGARIMNALAVGAFLGSQATGLTEWFIKPAIARVASSFESSAAEGASLVTLGSPFTAGRPAAVPVMADYRSVTTGDLAQAALAPLATAYAEMRQAWNALAAWVPLFDLAAPAIPATPARTVRRAVPPSQLAMGSIDLPGVTATTSVSGDLWLVTFANPQQGADHPLDFRVRFTPPGLEPQEADYRVTLRPAQYVVATLALAPSPDSVAEGGSLQLVATPRDSMGNAIAGQQVAWTSSRPAVATVDGAGMVRGLVMDTVTITATAGGRTASRRLRVAGDPLRGYTVQMLVYEPTYTSMGVQQTLQPRQAITVNNAVLYYLRLVHEGRPVGRIQQRGDFARAQYPIQSADHVVPGMTLTFQDTVHNRTVSFPLDVTLSNAVFRSLNGRTLTIRRADSPHYTSTVTVTPAMFPIGHTSNWYWEMCGGGLVWNKETAGALQGSFGPAGHLIVYADGTMGLNASYSCPNRPDRYVVE